MKGLSAIIITHNEAHDITRCLESLAGVAEEIIIVDDFSTDRTLDIAGNYTDKIFQRKFDAYGPQKQYALDKVTGDWVINIDADEELSPELRDELKLALKEGGNYSGFEMPFRVFFLGKRLRFGGCAAEHHIRLFKREKASYRGKLIHEGIIVDGRIGSLGKYVNHYTYASLEEYFEKFNRYTSLIAHEKNMKGKRFNVFQVLRLPWEFFMRYFLKLGFLDGWHGFVYALLASFYVLTKYLKLWDIQRKK